MWNPRSEVTSDKNYHDTAFEGPYRDTFWLSKNNAQNLGGNWVSVHRMHRIKKQDLFNPNDVFPVGIFRYKFLEIEIVFPGPDGFLEPETLVILRFLDVH